MRNWRFEIIKDEQGWFRTKLPDPLTREQVLVYLAAAQQAGFSAWITHYDRSKACETYVQSDHPEYAREVITSLFSSSIRDRRSSDPMMGWHFVYYSSNVPTQDQIDSFLTYAMLISPA